jgi:hypothetical protein
MIAKAPAWLQASAPSAEQKCGPAHSPAAQREGKGFALTSHSFNFTTKLFSLDFTWRRLEMDAQSQSTRAIDQKVPQRDSAARKQSAPAVSFDEVLKRQQLASLLTEDAPTPEHRETIQSSAMDQAVVFDGPAKRAYSQAIPQGPLYGARFYKA